MTSGKHIVVIATSFPDGEPGSEAAGSFVSDFVQELSQHMKVTAIVPGCRRTVDEERGNLTIRRFIVPSMPLSLLSPLNPAHWISIAEVMRSGECIVTQAVINSKVDHIVALWALPSGYWARNIWKKYGIPYSTWALGSDIWTLGKIPFVKRVLKRVLKESQACFADGYLLKGDVERISGRQCKFLPSLRNLSVEPKKDLASQPPYRLAFLGRWHPNKGIDLMLESLELLNDDDWGKIKEVRICGGGPLEKSVWSACEQLKKKGRPVTLGGYLNKLEAVDLLQWTDYLFIPSRIESIPVVFSDAMQIGCPVIVTPVGDFPRLLGNRSVGLIAEDVSSMAFAEVIRSACNTSPESFRIGLRKARGQFNVQLTAARLLKYIGR